jgi:putative hydrolases of HD superfamily
MLTKNFILKIFEAFYMERWNDKIRPMPLIELDKQAHKMIIAYFLGQFEETKKGFSWQEIIEGGIFELLQKIVLTDIKPPVFYKIKADQEKYQKLNEFVYNELKDLLAEIGPEFSQKFVNYFKTEKPNLNKKILGAAHIYASKWEFGWIEDLNKNSYDIEIIKSDFEQSINKFSDLEGIKHLKSNQNYRKFIDLCGQLRFQARWSNQHRIPKTSVLGHSLFVAILAYLMSLENGVNDKRKTNNFFTGLFHDLPEVLTRDILSPIKISVKGLDSLIKKYEKEQMEIYVHTLIPENISKEIRFFTENEFTDVPERDGQLVKAADDISAYIEAETAIKNGCINKAFKRALKVIREKYKQGGTLLRFL